MRTGQGEGLTVAMMKMSSDMRNDPTQMPTRIAIRGSPDAASSLAPVSASASEEASFGSRPFSTARTAFEAVVSVVAQLGSAGDLGSEA